MTKKNMNPSRRDFLLGTGATVTALSLADLLKPFEALAETPKKGGKFVYAGIPSSKHKTLKKAKHPYYGLEIRTTITYDRLTWVDENLNVVPQLATSWEAIEDDQTVWEAKIREGVKFHDGRDLTVEDVVASYKMHKDKKLGTSFSKKLVKDVEKAGSRKVRFHLLSPNSET